MSKQKSLILLKMLMGILNFAILTFLAVIILYTIGMVRATYTARSFLNHITYLPMNPVKTVIVMYVALFTLVAIINLRQQSENSILNQTIYILEVILCGIIICCVYMEYKGIIFLVIADIVVLIRDKTSQKVFLVIMGLIYIFADYDIISLGIKMVSFRELLNVYTVRQHMLMTGILNFFSSVNAIAFIAYMIIYMRSQIKEKERVTILNQQLAEANVQLSEMNNQLKDYAAMQVVYIALVTPGGTVSADVRAVSYIGIPLAMLALNSYGLDPASTKGVAMATSFGAMVGTLGTVLFYGTATINLVWQHIGWRAVEKGEFKKLYLVDMVLPWISHLICSFIPTVVMCKLGVPVVETIKATLPMDGLAMKTLFTVGSMLPCVGIAILLKQVVNKVTDFVPFFVGFTLAAGVGLNLVSVTVVAGMFAIIHYNIKMVGIRAKEAALASGGSFDDDDDEEEI